MERKVDKRNQLESQMLNLPSQLQLQMILILLLMMNLLNLPLNQMKILIHLLMTILLLQRRLKPLNLKRKKRRKLLPSQLLFLMLRFMNKILISKNSPKEFLLLPLMVLFGTKIIKFFQLLILLRNSK